MLGTTIIVSSEPSKPQAHLVWPSVSLFRAQDMIEQQLQHLVELGAAVHTLVAGDESGHCPAQLEAVQDLVRKLNEDRRAPSSVP